jgi:ParB/RepB/Spo0J family partition protein
MTTQSFSQIPVCNVHPSPTNPRRRFDEKKLAELAESMAVNGVLQPILVRPNKAGFEIVAGERRYRAAKLAKLTEIPAVVRELTNEQVIECQMVENGQREDVHPMEEAAGYEQLMKICKRDVRWIADRVGKSEKYVYDRIKLLELAKELQDLFWKGKIEAGHAILLARLTPAQQKAVLGEKREGYLDGGLLRPQRDLYLDDDEAEQFKAVSVRELEDYIKRNIRFSAAKADTFLFPETVDLVQAATQAKTKIIEITHDYLASDDVRQAGEARVYGERAWRRADVKEKSKTCDRSVLGVIASGPGQGQAFKVCVNKDRCTVHWGAEIKARLQRQSALAKGGPTADRARAKQNQDEARRDREREAQELMDARWEAATPALYKALAERVKTLPTKLSGVLCQEILDSLNSEMDPKEAAKFLPPGSTLEQFVRHLGFIALADKVTNWNGPQVFTKFAKSIGIDAQKILDEVAPVKKDETTDAKAKGKKKHAA